MLRTLIGSAVVAASAFTAAQAVAQDAVKIGLIVPLTGQQASTGKQIEAAVRLYMAQNGANVASKKIELLVKDDGAVPDHPRRGARSRLAPARRRR